MQYPNGFRFDSRMIQDCKLAFSYKTGAEFGLVRYIWKLKDTFSSDFKSGF